MISIRPHARGRTPAGVWRGFRRWRRSRPFWGGLFALLSGLWIFGTTQLSLGGLTFQLGPTGFLSWLIPTILAACGLLMWFTPGQRMFYGIVAAVTAVYSLIGVNLGGFFIGMLLGMVGAALGFAWTPLPSRPAPAGPTAEPAAEPVADPAAEPAGAPTATMDDLLDGRAAAPPGEVTGPMTDVLPPPYNPLAQPREPTRAQPRDPAHAQPRDPAHAQPGDPAATVGDDPGVHSGSQSTGGRPGAGGAGAAPGVPAPPHRPGVPGSGPGARLFAITFIAVTLSAVGAATLPVAKPAYAGPCPIGAAPPAVPPSAPTEPGTQPTGQPTEPGKQPTGQPTEPGKQPTATPTPGADSGGTGGAPEGEDGGNPVTDFVGGVVDGVKDLLGVGEDEARPAAAASPTATPTGGSAAAGKPAATPRPVRATTAGKRTPAAKRTTAASRPAPRATVAKVDSVDDLKGCTAEDFRQPGPVVRLDAEPGQPKVSPASRLTGSRVTMVGLSYDGVVELPMAQGTVRALKFSMDSSVTDDFELRTPGPRGAITSLKSSALTVEGNVKFYASRFHGTLLGIPLTFTPDSPPPLTLPVMVFGDPDIQLVFVDCDVLRAPNLNITMV
jgi:hypothetical protein